MLQVPSNELGAIGVEVDHGAAGAAAVKRSGGLAIAQDEESSAVYGMPKAALDAGVNISLSPDEIAERLRGLRHAPIAVLS